MNWTIIIIEAVVLTAAFTAMILIPLVKNPVWWIADYPEDIQEEYFKTHERIPSKFFYCVGSATIGGMVGRRIRFLVGSWCRLRHVAIYRLVRLFLLGLGVVC